MSWIRINLVLSLLIILGLTGSLTACQTFNISIIAPTKSVPTQGLKAATLPALWTPTPIPEYLLPLESLTPQAPEDYTQGPEWDSPDLKLSLPEMNFELGQFVNFVKVVGEILVVADNSGMLTIMDLNDPSNPVPMANINLGYEDRILAVEPGDPFSPPETMIAAEVRDVELEDGWLFVITLHRLLLFNVDDPYVPIPLAQLELPPRLTDLEVQDGYIRVLSAESGTGGIQLLELDAFTSPLPTIEYEAQLPDTAGGQAHLAGDLAFVTKRSLENAEQFKLYLIEESTNPIKLSEAYGAPAFRAWVVDDYAYISTGRVERTPSGGYETAVASIWVVDISNRQDPASYSYIWAPNIATGFYLTGQYAYAIGDDLATASGDVGDQYWMIVADMSDPEFPLVIRTLEFPGQPMQISGTRGVAYVAAGQAGLQVLWPEEGEALRLLEGEDLRASRQVEAGFLPYASNIPTQLAPFSQSYVDENVEDHLSFTVYRKRDLWDTAVGGFYAHEDFELEVLDFSQLQFPYYTGHGLQLRGFGNARISQSAEPFPGGKYLHILDCDYEIDIQFPDNAFVQSFGMDYEANEDWGLRFQGAAVQVPAAEQGFVGVKLHGNSRQEFEIACSLNKPDGIAIDNISFVPNLMEIPATIRATGTALPQPYATPTPGSLD